MSSTATYHGGPAFPQKEPLTSDHHGMTLRDYFAAKALSGYFANPSSEFPNIDVAAQMFYAAADAMLKARES
jgi:hypothetical protein